MLTPILLNAFPIGTHYEHGPVVHQAHARILASLDANDPDAAYRALIGAGLSPEDAPALWERLASTARAAGAEALAAEIARALWTAGLRSLDLALDLARDALAAGRPGEAAVVIEESFGAAPEDVEARLLLAEALAGTAPGRVAELAVPGALDSPRLSVLAVDALRAAGEFRKGLDLATKARALFPEEPRLTARLARLEDALGRPRDALGTWAALRTARPDLAVTAMLEEMRLHVRLEDQDAARQGAAELLRRDLSLLQRLILAETFGLDRMIETEIAAAAERGIDAETGRALVEWLSMRGRIGALAWIAARGVTLPEVVETALGAMMVPRERTALATAPLARAMALKTPDMLLPLPPEVLARIREELGPPAGPDGPVLIVNATLAAGGAERQFTVLAEAILATGLPVERLHAAVFSLLPDRGHDHFRPGLERLGLTLHNLRGHAAPLGPHTSALISSLPEPLRGDLAALLPIAAALKPRVLHGWQDRAGLAAGFAGLLLGTPRVVMSARNMQPARRGDRTGYARALYAHLAARPDVVLTANATPAAQDYETWLALEPGAVQELRNGLDMSGLPLRRAPARRLRRGLVVGGVFRLAANKRPELWLRTVAALRTHLGPSVQPRLVGNGPFEADVFRIAEALGFAPLDHAAHLSRPEEIYAGMDMLLLMSRVEGTPNVVLEAQALGLPVAACDVGGVSDALAPEGLGAGLLLPEEIGPDEAAERIGAWWPETRRTGAGAARRRAVEARFSLDALSASIKTLYGGHRGQG